MTNYTTFTIEEGETVRARAGTSINSAVLVCIGEIGHVVTLRFASKADALALAARLTEAVENA